MSKILAGLLLLISQSIFAAQFVASVRSLHIEANSSIELNLSLEDAKAKSPPDLSALEDDFSVHRQHQYSRFSNINGVTKSESGWQITLIPKRSGDLTIPSISINSDQGILTSKPIGLHVTASSGNTPRQNVGVSMVSALNKTQVYVKEPLVYTLKIIGYKPWVNVSLDDISSNDAIVDRVGEPKQYQQNLAGIRANIVEVSYFITPLTAGKIKINPARVQGDIVGYGLFDSKPFALVGEELSFTALPPALKTSNWLPLQDLQLSEEFEGLSGIKVGDTIIRRVKINSIGGFANQLPSVNEFMQSKDFKTYSNKPQLNNEVNHQQQIIASKIEEFSLVPQKSGRLLLPEVRIQWWNIKTKQMESSVLAARTIEVLAANNLAAQDAVVDYSQANLAPEQQAKVIFAISAHKWLYIIIGLLLAIIVIMGLAFIYVLKRKAKSNNLPTKTKRYSNFATVQQLRDHILDYAHSRWGVTKNISLAQLVEQLRSQGYQLDYDIYQNLCQQINSALYANQTVALQEIAAIWQKFKSTVRMAKGKTKTSFQVNSFNPT